MIVDSILVVVWAIVGPLINLLPDIVIPTNESLYSSFFDFISVACFFVPLDTVAQIFLIIIGLMIIRVVIAFVKMIWGVLPVL